MVIAMVVIGSMITWGMIALAIGTYRTAMKTHNTDTEGDTR